MQEKVVVKLPPRMAEYLFSILNKVAQPFEQIAPLIQVVREGMEAYNAANAAGTADDTPVDPPPSV